MSRYIDEKEVYKLVEPNGVARVHCSQIDELPRADMVEVRHGYWVRNEDHNAYESEHFCSVCLADGSYDVSHENYCYNCGAKMDGERSENGKS
jgi:hypothetical protein